MEKTATPATPDPGCFTDEEFIEFLTEQGFWVDNLLTETEPETKN